MLKLGVNIDHVATLRQARYGRDAVKWHSEPSVVAAAKVAQGAGAHGITIHLREDRRHIQDTDLMAVRGSVKRLNQELSISPEMVRIALRVKPDIVCLVPENRQEITTEGGLDVTKHRKRIQEVISLFHKARIQTSIFIEANADQLEMARETETQFVELHTGSYANAKPGAARRRELKRLIEGAELAHALGLRVNAGHGIHYDNVLPLLEVPFLEELNIGHSIVSRSIFVGLEQAIHEFLDLLREHK